MHYYIDCEIVTSNDKSHYTFKVRTDIGLVFMFQVSDRAALDRWINWFRGGSTLANNNMIPNKEKNEKDQHQRQQQQQQQSSSGEQPQLDQLPPIKMQSTTFGIADSTAGYSSFYNPSFIMTDHLPQITDDHSQSALYGQSSISLNDSAVDRGAPMGSGSSFGLTVNKNNNENGHSFGPIGNNNSFGVIDPSWKRYP